MQRSIYQHIILDTVLGTAADLLVKERHLYIAGTLMYKLDDVSRGSVVKETSITSETAGVVTYTPPATPVNSTTYSIQFRVANPGATGAQDDPLVFNVSVTTPATGTLTATTLADQFRTVLATSPYSTYVTGSGTATLIITGNSGYPIVIGSSTSPITSVQTTIGVAKRGTPTAMAALGVGTTYGNTVYLNGTQSLAGTKYTLYTSLEHRNIGESVTDRVNQGMLKMLWINEDDGDAAALIAAIDLALAGDSTYQAAELQVLS